MIQYKTDGFFCGFHDETARFCLFLQESFRLICGL